MINPVAANVGDLLSSSQFQVPKFQRGYEWRETHATEFWEDLQNYVGSSDGGPFLGTFIFMPTEDAKDRLVIIDGQQRITTILLFLIACRTIARGTNKADLAHEIQRKITFIDSATAQSRGTRLIASPTIKEAFEAIASSEWQGEFGDMGNRRQVNRLRPVYQYFYERIDQEKHKLSDFLRAIYSTTVVRIDIKNIMDAFDVFERTNARGVDLEVADLLKNFLFKEEVEELDEKWDTIATNSDGNTLRMLKYFYIAKKGQIRKSELYKELKRYGETVGAEALTEELVEFSTFYKKARTANQEGIKEVLDSLGAKSISHDQERLGAIFGAIEGLRLFKIFQVYPILYAAMKCFGKSPDTSKRAKLFVRMFESLEKYHFINNSVCERIGNQVEKIYADFCTKYISANSDFDKVTNELIDALKKQLAPEDEFMTRFIRISYETREIPRLMYILDRMNNVGRPAGQRLRIFNPDDLRRRNWNIEHFFPQNPDGKSALKLDAVDNIGNLLPLDFRTNSALSNRTPQEKIEWLHKDDNLRMVENMTYVRDFIHKYAKHAIDWTDVIIAQRAKDMAKDAYEKVWRI